MSEPVPDPRERRYSEAEFVRILRTAAALQDEDAPDERRQGLTLAEIEQVAAEVGIEARHVVAAAAVVATQSAETWRRMLALPVQGGLARVLPGDVPDEAWPGVVATIRTALGEEGRHAWVPGALEWTHSDAGSEIRVEVTRGEAATHVQVSADHRQAVALYLLTAPVLGGAVAVVPAVLLGVGEALGPWPLIAAGAGGGGVLGWVSLRATCARWQRRFRQLIEDLSLRTHGVAVDRTSQIEE